MSRRGFTLVEVLVALVIAGMAVSTAASIIGSSTDLVGRMDARSLAWGRDANARRWLAEVFVGAAVGAGHGEFVGTATRVTFDSWLWVPDGWREPGRITVAIRDDRVVAEVAGGGEFVLFPSVTLGRFEYLIEPGAQSRWRSEWQSDVTVPLALRLHVRRMSGIADTLLIYLGERG